MKRKALRAVADPETRRLNEGLDASSTTGENGTAEGGGTAWASTGATNNLDVISQDGVTTEWTNEDGLGRLEDNIVLPEDTEDLGEGNGGGGGGGTGYAYASNGGSSQGSGQGGGDGGGAGRVINEDGSISEGDGDGTGQGSGLAYAYAQPGGMASSSGSGNGAGYGGGIGANGEEDGNLGALSQNAEGEYGEEDGEEGSPEEAYTYGVGIASAFSAGDGMAYGFGTGRGIWAGDGDVELSDGDLQQTSARRPMGYGFTLDDGDGTFSTNSATTAEGAPAALGRGEALAGPDGIGIGIGIGLGPSSTQSSGGDGDLSANNADLSGLPGLGGTNLRITLDISS